MNTQSLTRRGCESLEHGRLVYLALLLRHDVGLRVDGSCRPSLSCGNVGRCPSKSEEGTALDGIFSTSFCLIILVTICTITTIVMAVVGQFLGAQ